MGVLGSEDQWALCRQWRMWLLQGGMGESGDTGHVLGYWEHDHILQQPSQPSQATQHWLRMFSVLTRNPAKKKGLFQPGGSSRAFASALCLSSSDFCSRMSKSLLCIGSDFELPRTEGLGLLAPSHPLPVLTAGPVARKKTEPGTSMSRLNLMCLRRRSTDPDLRSPPAPAWA